MATDYNKLKVVDLKAELKNRGLPQNGLKAELVARLEAAEAEAEAEVEAEQKQETETEAAEDAVPENTEPAPSEEPAEEPAEGTTKDLTTQDVSDDVKPSEDTPDAVGPAASNESVQDPLPDPPTAQDPPTTTAADVQGPASEITPAPSAEVVRDSQKRKRRSGSPQPSAEDVARKRARQEDQEDPDVEPEAPSDVDMEGVRGEPSAEPDIRESSRERLVQEAPDENAHITGTSADIPGENDSASSRTVARMSPEERSPAPNVSRHSEMNHDSEASRDLEADRDVEPATHPATSALYIKNFMRPLRPQAVQEHLLELATPPRTAVDESTIVNFYLDNIKTHAFIVFNSISAASRVRTALHSRVWPDETNRKPLLVDFIPPERFADWVDMEQGSRGGRGSSNRYEVVYERDNDGNVVARLDESGAAPPVTKQPPSQPPPPERKMSIPTGPSRPFAGVEGAPLGPRGFQQGGGRGPQVHPSRLERLSEHTLTTRAFPTISYRPVSEEVADRRLAALSAIKSRDPDRDFGKDYRRYYFENGDYFVDRGAEIFLGIRPPHRERERREEQTGERERRGGRNRRGRGPRRGGGGPPLYHGVPRGGDRFRPQDSGSRYGDDRYRGDRY